MAVKKSELYASLWKSADELRGGMDASQYKDYVLVLLFMKYVSDKAVSQANYLLDVPAGASFADMVALKGDKEIGDKINKIIRKLAEANDLTGVIDVADFNDEDKLGRGKEMVDRLSNLVSIFENPALDFRGNRAEGDDLLGDAYEYLMRHFATESGKSKGQFYTPAEVSRIMAKVVGVRGAMSGTQTIYDPTCGSGSLLLKAHYEAASETGLDLAIYGQEMDVATAALARMNMILHDVVTADIWRDNTMSAPHFRDGKTGRLKTFDFVVANPPFSNKAWRSGFSPEHDEFERFSAPFVVPPQKNGDYAFLLHIVASMKSTGKAAVILPHGVLFRPNAEAANRREIVRRGYLKAIIGLPPNLFYGTGIPACVLVLDKEHAATRDGVFMIDASRGFRKDGNKNRLREQDIHRIVDVFNRLSEVDRYARFVPLSEIEGNDYNLNLARYIDSSPPHDLHDVAAHLRGGIPSRDLDVLSPYWDVLPALRRELFETDGAPGYELLRVDPERVPATVFEHSEFAAFRDNVVATFDEWRNQARPVLCAFDRGRRPNDLITEISESLLAAFRPAPLISSYNLYQRLMDYWSASLRDDAYLIAEGGWAAAAKPRLLANGRGAKESADVTIGKQAFKSDLLPASILVERYLADDRYAIEEREQQLALLDAEIAQLAEEHGAEGGALEEVVDDKGKLVKRALVSALKSLEDVANEDQEVMRAALAALERQAAAKQELAAAQGDLQRKIADVYETVTEDEVRSLIVDSKWLAHLDTQLRAELDAVSRGLADRLVTLARRYRHPLPILVQRSNELADTVTEHLTTLGYRWNQPE